MDRQGSGIYFSMLSDLLIIHKQTSFTYILACVDLAFVFYLCCTVNYGGKRGQEIWKVCKRYGLTVTLSCSVLYGQYQWWCTLPFFSFLWFHSPNQVCATLEVSRSHIPGMTPLNK
jgi:hypothetical protein